MDIRERMQEEFQHESQLTRSVFDVVPDSLLDYQAGDAMHTIRWNVSHLVDIPTWADMILNQASFDVAPVGQPPHTTPELKSMAAAIEAFDKHIAEAQSVLADFSLESLDDPWSLLTGGQTLLKHPRHLIYRMYMVSHVAHHRAHLLVYLRLNGIETPHLYG